MGAGCLLAVWLVKDMGVYNTECRMVAAITNKQYFFELSTLPNVIWTDLSDFDLSPGSGVRLLNPDDIDLSGNVSGKYEAGAAPY
jgi:choloylglycine hydrolase